MSHTQDGTISPNPNYPQNINITTGENIFKKIGKNLFDKNNITILSIGTASTTSNVNTIFTSSTNQKHVYIKCEPNTTYTITKETTVNTVLGIFESSQIPSIYVGCKVLYFSSSNNGTKTITTSATAKYLDLRLNSDATSEADIQTIINSIQIEIGSTATLYEPYQEQNYSIDLGNLELRRLNGYHDTLFKAVEGNSIYDSLSSSQKADLDNGAWYKYGIIGKGSASNLSNTKQVTSTIGSNLYAIATDVTRINQSVNTIGSVISNILPPKVLGTTTDTTNPNNVRFYQGISKHTSTNTQIVISADKTYLAEESISGFLNFLSTYNFVFYFIVATPFFTKITDTTLITQLEALYSLKTYSNQTNIAQTNDNLSFIINATALLKNA